MERPDGEGCLHGNEANLILTCQSETFPFEWSHFVLLPTSLDVLECTRSSRIVTSVMLAFF